MFTINLIIRCSLIGVRPLDDAKFSGCLTSWVSTIRSAKQAEENATIAKIRRLIGEPLPGLQATFSSSSVIPIPSVDPIPVAFDDSKNTDEEGEGEEVMVETPIANVTSSAWPSRGRKKKLTSAVWLDFYHVEQDLGIKNWQQWSICKLFKKCFNVAFAHATNNLRNCVTRCKTKYAQGL